MVETPATHWSDDLLESDELPAARLRPRKHFDDMEMDITPMIDITFLLLIFFVVASKMDKSTNVQLPKAQFGVAVPTKNAVIVTVAPGERGGPASIYGGDGADIDTRINYGDLAALETALEDYVSDTLLDDPRKQLVLIKASGALKHREVARVAQAVSRVTEVQGLHIAVLEEQ